MMKSNSELYLEQYKDIYDNKIILDDKLATDNNLDLFYNEIKDCSGILYKIESHNDICMFENK